MTEFVGFPKIPRLFREMVVTEKLDGTNACIVIEEYDGSQVEEESTFVAPLDPEWATGYAVTAQSRSRIITPTNDNHGFAAWVWENAQQIFEAFGPGRHFGEWWGSGVNRGYGLQKGEKRFSPFNVKRWGDFPFVDYGLTNVAAVPVLYEGPFDTLDVEAILADLKDDGSLAAPGYMNPEGVVIFHKAGNYLFKATLENDAEGKGV